MAVTTDFNPNLNWSKPLDGTTSTDTSNNTNSNSTGLATNPKAELDKDAFLQLLLIELQHQDPTEPMDSEKILTQTAQLSSLEMQQNTNKTMQSMVEAMQVLTASFSNQMATSSVNAIGKMASVETKTVKLTGVGDVIAMTLYLPEKSDKNGVTVEIYDKDNNLVKTQKSEEKEIAKGNFIAEWNGLNNDGIYAGNGDYTVKVVYNNEKGEKVTSEYGTYMVEGIVFKEGIAYAKMGGQEVPFDKIVSITDYKV